MNRKIERLFDEELLMKSREAKERFLKIIQYHIRK